MENRHKRRAFLKQGLGMGFSAPAIAATSQDALHFELSNDNPIENAFELANVIENINSIAGSKKIQIVLKESILITAELSGKKTSFKKCNASRVTGLPEITKSNVAVDFQGFALVIDRNVDFYKIEKKLCKNSDRTCHGLTVSGENFELINANIFGSVGERDIYRNEGRGHGGEDFGLVLTGDNAKITNTSISNFVTDSVLLDANSKFRNCYFSGSLRNQFSVVNSKGTEIKVELENVIIDGKKQKHGIRPGSGLHVECNAGKAAVIYNGGEIKNTNGSSIRLSVGATNCHFNNIQIDGKVHIVDRKECNHGGHTFMGPSFTGNIVKRYRKCK